MSHIGSSDIKLNDYSLLQIGGYPITPNQRPAGWVADSNYPNTSYPPPTVPGSYPLAPQPSHIPSAPSYPLFNPNSCQQYNPNTGNISLAPSTSGPLASSNGIYPLLPSQGVQAPRQQIPSIPVTHNFIEYIIDWQLDHA